MNVTFENRSVNCTTYQWDFGDGASSTDEHPFHLYEISGSYDVKLVASGEHGSDEMTQTIELVDPPVDIFIGLGAAGIVVHGESDPLSKVIDKFGKNNKETLLTGTKGYMWIIDYPEKGLLFKTSWAKDEASKLSSVIREIYVKAPYKGLTERGIAIGSSKADVLAAYPEGQEGFGSWQWNVGLDYFEFSNEKLSKIGIGY